MLPIDTSLKKRMLGIVRQNTCHHAPKMIGKEHKGVCLEMINPLSRGFSRLRDLTFYAKSLSKKQSVCFFFATGNLLAEQAHAYDQPGQSSVSTLEYPENVQSGSG